MSGEPVFARRVFRIAGWYGLAVTLPLYVLEGRIGADQPPPIAHPEFYYGFAGVCAAFQLVFLFIASDPRRYRPLMLAAMAEKLSVVGVLAQFALGRLPWRAVGLWPVDLLWLALFVAAYRRTPAGS